MHLNFFTRQYRYRPQTSSIGQALIITWTNKYCQKKKHKSLHSVAENYWPASLNDSIVYLNVKIWQRKKYNWI